MPTYLFWVYGIRVTRFFIVLQTDQYIFLFFALLLTPHANGRYIQFCFASQENNSWAAVLLSLIRENDTGVILFFFFRK